MKKIFFTIIIFIYMTTSAFSAFNWESKGMNLVESGSSDNENFIVLEYDASVKIKVRYQGKLDDKWADAIYDIFSRFNKWEYMEMDRVDFFVTNNTLEILVIPSKFKYKETDFMPHIPGGMTFIYDTYLRYNFRVTKDNFFVRVNDRFFTEEMLASRIKEAVDDPVGYLAKRDPEFFLQKLTELEGNYKNLREEHDRLVRAVLYFQNSGFLGFGNSQVKNSIIRKVIEIKASEPELKADEIRKKLSEQGVEAKEKEIKLILNVFYNEF